MLMRISDLHVSYGAVCAIDGVTMEVQKGEVVSLIGANGAGKSTLLRTVAGILKPLSGGIEFAGGGITRQRPDRIVRLGISLVPEGRQIFPELTVRENLEVGGHAVRGRRKSQTLFEMVLATFPRLREGSASMQAPFPEGSSRCSPSEGPLWPTRSSFCSTSLPWASRRS